MTNFFLKGMDTYLTIEKNSGDLYLAGRTFQFKDFVKTAFKGKWDGKYSSRLGLGAWKISSKLEEQLVKFVTVINEINASTSEVSGMVKELTEKDQEIERLRKLLEQNSIQK